MKKVLVLGAGLVSGPLVEYLLERGYRLTVASRTLSKARMIIGDHENGFAVRFDITDEHDIGDLVKDHDVVISLLPYVHHVDVAKVCIEKCVSMVTTSYVSEEMRSLDLGAKEAGIILLNEMGLDPGIDHMEAQRVIDEVHEKGGKVLDFISYCGGLPAPEANTNPWGYKFSWSPKGVVLASKNSARFRRDGKIVEIPGEELFGHYEIVDISDIGEFEGYPNRDSIPYAGIYNIPEARTVLRGTLRNIGWCDTWKALHDIGLLEEMPLRGTTYREMIDDMLPGEGDIEYRLRCEIETRDDDTAISNMEWLGLLSENPLPDVSTRQDALSYLLESQLQYGERERDMIILQHRFRISVDGEERSLSSTMVDYGRPGGESAMSRTVGLPAAIGADMILSGDLDGESGVMIPTLPKIYLPALDRLARLGIEFINA